MDNRTEQGEHRYDKKPLPRLDFSKHLDEPVVQMVWVEIDRHAAKDPAFRSDDGVWSWAALKRDTEAPTRNSFLRRSGKAPHYVKFPLIDAPLPSARLVNGISYLLKWASQSRLNNMYEFSRAAAGCFSMPVSLPGGLQLAMAPLSTEFFLQNADSMSTQDQIAPDEHKLKLGQWALLLVHECHNAWNQDHLDEEAKADSKVRVLKRLRYALVSPADQGFKVVDVHGLSRTQKRSRFFRRPTVCKTEATISGAVP